MSKDNDTFIELVTRFLSDEAEEKEVKALEVYLQDQEYSDWFKRISKQWKFEEGKLSRLAFSKEKGKKLFYENLSSATKEYSYLTASRTQRPTKFIFKYAAVITFLLLAGLFLFNNYKKEQIPKVASIEWKEKLTVSGEKAQITMKDGTKILLNSSSKIKYPAEFNEITREVYLEGEAYFEVAHNPNKSFIIQSGTVEIEVLGTTFNVSAYAEDNSIAVSLLEGKVSVKKIGSVKQDTLNPMQQYYYNKGQELALVQPFNVKAVFGWKDNEFVFDDMPLGEVTKILARQYGVPFKYENEGLKKCTIRADFENEPLWTVLDILSYVGKINYEIINKDGKIDTVILKGNGCI
ncbi:MAG: FecR domain-containing protein [Bacteroidota bacterium]